MATVKLTIFNARLKISASIASAIVTYFVDLEGVGNLDSPDILAYAATLVPQIGSYQDFPNVSAAPSTDPSSQYSTVVHSLRVSNIEPYVGTTNNSKKLFVDVFYDSRPRPTIEFGSSGNQQRVETYNSSNQDHTSGTTAGERRQMTVDFLLKAGSLQNDSNGIIPEVDTPMLKTPGSGIQFQFGSSIILGSTYYGDELTVGECNILAALYTTCVNKDPLFFSSSTFVSPRFGNVALADDSTCWLCTSIKYVTNDGGWTIKLAAEFVYNPYGWDTRLVYTYPFTQQPVTGVSQDILNNLFARPTPGTYTSEPYVPTQGGVARYPQQLSKNMTNLVEFISQGTLLGPSPAFDAILQG